MATTVCRRFQVAWETSGDLPGRRPQVGHKEPAYRTRICRESKANTLADRNLSRYRDQSRYEVDAVLENRSGQVVGIEIKAATTVGPDDFRGLRRLADRLATTSSPASSSTPEPPRCRSAADSAPFQSVLCGRFPLHQQTDFALVRAAHRCERPQTADL